MKDMPFFEAMWERDGSSARPASPSSALPVRSVAENVAYDATEVDILAREWEHFSEKLDTEPVSYGDVRSDSLRSYVLGEFQYFMGWFVRLASVRDGDMFPEPFREADRQRTKSFVQAQLKAMTAERAPLRRRFVSAFVSHIRLPSTKAAQGKRLFALQQDLEPYVVAAKRSLLTSPPQDHLQRTIVDVVAYLVKHWAAQTDAVAVHLPRHPTVRRIYQKRMRLLADLHRAARDRASSDRYASSPRPTRRSRTRPSSRRRPSRRKRRGA